MASIDDPVLVRACNEEIRPLADALARAHMKAKLVLANLQARGIAFPDDPAAFVADGSPGDGRTPVSGADVNRLIRIAGGWMLGNEANDNEAAFAILRVAVNPGL